jgi:hypothetical protein
MIATMVARLLEGAPATATAKAAAADPAKARPGPGATRDVITLPAVTNASNSGFPPLTQLDHLVSASPASTHD